MEYSLAIKRMKSCYVQQHHGPKGVTLSEINQTEKDKYHMISFICGIKKKKTQGKNPYHTKLIDTGNRLVVARGEGRGWPNG